MIKIIRADGKTEFEAIRALSSRDEAVGAETELAVRAILEDVRLRGDEAVAEYSLRFDGFVPEKLTADRAEMKASYDAVSEDFRAAIQAAAANIRRYHEKQLDRGYEEKRADGVILGQIARGLDRVGLYVPGGTAAYPSTVLMNGIPARIAGVRQLIMTTPHGREPDDRILAVAYEAGVDQVV